MNKEKFNIVKGMNEVILSMNNEEAYMTWIYIVPDEASDYDFMDIADDEELFADTVQCFKRLMNKYLKDGLYIDGKLY